MTQTQNKLQEKLDAAVRRENDAGAALAQAARAYAAIPPSTKRHWDALTAAAKRWTNAMHQRSRCEKHLREVSL